MVKVAFVGWRGLVGSVLLKRLKEENDFKRIETSFFSSSSPGKKAPLIPQVKPNLLKDAYSIQDLIPFDIIVTCQGSEYTKKVYYELREKGWQGYWLDAASYLRMKEESTLVLDPLNQEQIQQALMSEKKDFIGANCTVSLMMMALHGLFKEGLIEWIHTASYQAISGAGSAAIYSLFEDLNYIAQLSTDLKKHNQESLLKQIDQIHSSLNKKNLETKQATLGTNILPWIDKLEERGRTEEEAKGERETNKILGRNSQIPIDGTCVRVPVLRSHSQTLTLKLKEHMDPSELESLIKNANPWIKLIPNTQESSLNQLSPLHASSSLDILVGRVRKLKLPGNIFEVFTVGDQLLWGACEPIRRCLNLIVDFLTKES